jgi:predicted 3-demethylubiquinone-9 3-methyltransferase (glyoxalase superfamily)
MQKVTPFLWFDRQAEEAVDFYCRVFRDARKGRVAQYPQDTPGGQAGEVMTVEFELLGVKFVALNGGDMFKFSQATSFVINCESQEEVDHYWNNLSEGGEIQMCGWLVDKYGVSWQVTPVALFDYINDSDPGKAKRAMSAMLEMQKIDISKIEQAANAG